MDLGKLIDLEHFMQQGKGEGRNKLSDSDDWSSSLVYWHSWGKGKGYDCPGGSGLQEVCSDVGGAKGRLEAGLLAPHFHSS